MADVPGTINFPTSLDTAVSLITASNDFATTLAADYTPGATTLTVVDNSRAQASGTLTVGTAKLILTYTNKSGSTLFTGVARATLETNNPADVGILTGAAVNGYITGRHHGALRDALIAVETKLGIGGATVAATYAPRGSSSAMWPVAINGNYQVGTWNRGFGPFTADGAMTVNRYRMDLGAGSTLQVDLDTANCWSPSSKRSMKLTHVYGGGGAAGYSRILTISGEVWQWQGHPVSYGAWVKSSVAGAVRIALYDGTTLGTTKAANTGGAGLPSLVGCGQSGTNRSFSAYHSGSGLFEYLQCPNFIAGSAGNVFYMETWIEKTGTFYLDDNPCIFGPTCQPSDQFHNGEPYAGIGQADGAYQVIGINQAWVTSGPLDVRTFTVPFRTIMEGGITAVLATAQGSHTGLTNCTLAMSAVLNATTEVLNASYTVTPIAAGPVVVDQLWAFVSTTP